MTRQPKSMVPKVRFKGFTDEWEHRELGEVSEKITQKNKDNLYSVTLTNSAEYGIIDQRSFFDKDISNAKNLSNYYVVHPDDFVYNPRISNEAPVGPIKRNNLDITGVMSPLYYVFRPHDINKTFLEYYFSTSKWHKFMKLNGNSGARSDRFSIKDSEFVKMPIPSPKNEEQVKIGKLLSTVATYLALQQHKLDQLNTLKKGLLQKMFADKKHPKRELRFKSFHDNWINHKAGDFMIERNQKATIDDDFPLKAFIANKGVADKGERYDRSAITNDASNKMYKRTLFNDFIYSSNNLETGSIGLNKYGNASISPVYSIFYFKNKESADFFGRILVRKEFINSMIRYRQGVVYGQWRIKEKDFLNISISVPSLEEQEKIGSLLDKLDETINVNSKLLNQLKVLKKFLLQNMFI